MYYLNKEKDFRYSGFWLSKSDIRDYINEVNRYRASNKWYRRYNPNYASGIIESMIESIAENRVEFDRSDKEMCALIEELIVKGGYDDSGVYSETAHQAMNNFCKMVGENPAQHVLRDKTLSRRISDAKSKIKGFFGFGKKAKAEPVATPAPQADTAAPKSKKGIMYKLTATIGGLLVVGGGLLISSDKAGVQSDAPTFKPVSVADTSHTIRQNYSLKDSTVARPFAVPKKVAPRVTQHKTVKAQSVPVATDSVSVGLTRASKSSLDILLGAAKADELCRQVESQIKAGIFAAPAGMSVERIAHAMTMSRIYEGHSIVLDALNAKTKLTPAQQAAFVAHIAEIGDLGRGIQSRMAAKHNLSAHSKFNKATKSMQRAHVKNLKQLKQLRKMAHTR